MAVYLCEIRKRLGDPSWDINTSFSADHQAPLGLQLGIARGAGMPEEFEKLMNMDGVPARDKMDVRVIGERCACNL